MVYVIICVWLYTVMDVVKCGYGCGYMRLYMIKSVIMIVVICGMWLYVTIYGYGCGYMRLYVVMDVAICGYGCGYMW